MQKKKCKDCREFFPLREFVSGKRKLARCKECYNKKTREYYHQNKWKENWRKKEKPKEEENFSEANIMATVRLGEQRHRNLSRRKELLPEPIRITVTR